VTRSVWKSPGPFPRERHTSFSTLRAKVSIGANEAHPARYTSVTRRAPLHPVVSPQIMYGPLVDG
jgi:hypothetical protein